MKDLLKKPLTIEKVEFWAATFIYACLTYVLVYNLFMLTNTGNVNTPNFDDYIRRDVPYSYLKNYFIPQFFKYTAFYGAFLVFNFLIVQSLATGRRVVLSIALTLLLFVTLTAVLGTIGTWMQSYLFKNLSERYVYRRVFKGQFTVALWATALVIFYNITKYCLLYFYKTYYKTGQLSRLNRECLAALGVWFLSVVFMGMAGWYKPIIIFWAEVTLFGIGLYWFSTWQIIPELLAEKALFKTFLLKVAAILCLSFFPIAVLCYTLIPRIEAALVMNLLNAGAALFVVAPLSWYLYNSRLEKNAELTGLKTALNQTSANVDLLRSQINPHFLFNALNTLYGTALQENADRTGEGIQKLGDMMRFMLQENVQEQISLTREVDYLDNYIALQKLRTQTSPDILIQTEIEEQLNGLQIAPMLLIPFVENAFKHGISLRNPSHIKITLNTKGNELFFDVYNSTHAKPDNDPEQNKSGIGLENVRQRLQLVYPGRHELVIRESAKEFFVHLTLHLT